MKRPDGRDHHAGHHRQTRKRRSALAITFLLALLAGLMGFAGTSQAALLHSFDSYIGGGSLAAPEALTVDQTTGDLYIVEHGSGCVSRYFGERGGPEALEPHDFPATGTNQVCGFEFREPAYFFGDGTANSQVAVDNSGTATEGKFYVNSPGPNTGDPAVTLGFDAEGNLETELTERRTPEDYASLRWPCGVATDDAGNVYVDEALVRGPEIQARRSGHRRRFRRGSRRHVARLLPRHRSRMAATTRSCSPARSIALRATTVLLDEDRVVKGATARSGPSFDEFGAGEVTESHGVADRRNERHRLRVRHGQRPGRRISRNPGPPTRAWNSQEPASAPFPPTRRRSKRAATKASVSATTPPRRRC